MTARSTLLAEAIGSGFLLAVVATVSTGFANPLVTIGRVLTDSYTGIEPASAPAFIIAQLLGAGLAVGAARVLLEEGERTHV